MGGKASAKRAVHPAGGAKAATRLEGRLFREGRQWISHCPALDVATCGDTREEALNNTAEAVVLFFESCIEHGTLEKALKELGWEKTDPKFLEALPQERDRIHPPVFILDRKANNSWSERVEFI